MIECKFIKNRKKYIFAENNNRIFFFHNKKFLLEDDYFLKNSYNIKEVYIPYGKGFRDISDFSTSIKDGKEVSDNMFIDRQRLNGNTCFLFAEKENEIYLFLIDLTNISDGIIEIDDTLKTNKIPYWLKTKNILYLDGYDGPLSYYNEFKDFDGLIGIIFYQDFKL